MSNITTKQSVLLKGLSKKLSLLNLTRIMPVPMGVPSCSKPVMNVLD